MTRFDGKLARPHRTGPAELVRHERLLEMIPSRLNSGSWEERMIKGLHAMFNSPKAEEVRAFLRDKLDLPFTDTGDGWLIFDAPAADIGSHPADEPSHSISFWCDDINGTVQELKGRGVELTKEITDAGWGFITSFKLPDGSEIDLYEPKYNK